MTEVEANEPVEDQRIVPELTPEEKIQMEADVKKATEEAEDKLPDAPDYPLADLVAELKLDEKTESEEFYKDLEAKDVSMYHNMKDMPDSMAKKYMPDMCRRFIACERRIKVLEKMLWELPRTDRSLEEDRFEILTELLDKACQGFDIWDEHVTKKIRLGHRLVLEGRLVHLIDTKFDIITKVCNEFDKLRGEENRYEVNNEREWLRYEIRHTDMMYTELHEHFLKSYLDMDW